MLFYKKNHWDSDYFIYVCNTEGFFFFHLNIFHIETIIIDLIWMYP